MKPFFRKCYYCQESKIEAVTDDVKGSWMECSVCGRVVEERQPKLKHTTFSVYRWAPFEVVSSSSSKQQQRRQQQRQQQQHQHDKPKADDHNDGGGDDRNQHAVGHGSDLDSGFVTCFSQMNHELYSVDLAFSRSLSGDVIELQKLIGDDLLKGFHNEINDRKKIHLDASFSSDNVMIGYVTIDDLCTTFGTPMKKNRAIKLFLRCIHSSVYEQGTNFEALAVAAFAVLACREFKDVAAKLGGNSIDDNDSNSNNQDSSSNSKNQLNEHEDEPSSSTHPPPPPHPQRGNQVGVGRESVLATAQGIDGQPSFYDHDSQHAAAAMPSFPHHTQEDSSTEVTWDQIIAEARQKSVRNSISDSEIRKHVGMISNVVNNEPVVVEALRKSMSKYFKDLSLEKETASLAAHIGNQAVKRHLCYRRNSSSLSAASVYLACQLQGMRTTQNSFCKTVGLTEVTLRKVYKELKNHWQSLVPEDYKPFKVPNGLKHNMPLRVKKVPDSFLDKSGLGLPSFGLTKPARGDSAEGKFDKILHEKVNGLEAFTIPKQFSLEGRYLWTKDQKSPSPKEILQPYPRPTIVYADLDASGPIPEGCRADTSITEIKDQYPGIAPVRLAGTTRSMVRPKDKNLIHHLDSFGKLINTE